MSRTFGKCLTSRSLTVAPSVGGPELLFQQFDVLAVHDGGQDGGVGAGPPDALFLQRLHQGRLAEPRRRLGEVLLGGQCQQIERLPFGQRRQRLPVLILNLVRVVRALPINAQEAVKLDGGARRPERVVLRGDVHGDDIEDGGGHLRRDEALPDQFIQPRLVVRQQLAPSGPAGAPRPSDGSPRGRPAPRRPS